MINNESSIIIKNNKVALFPFKMLSTLRDNLNISKSQFPPLDDIKSCPSTGAFFTKRQTEDGEPNLSQHVHGAVKFCKCGTVNLWKSMLGRPCISVAVVLFINYCF